jgi:hypothetical protein
MASGNQKRSKQGTAGKKKHITLILQKLEIIRRLEHGKSRSIVISSYNTGSSTLCDIKKQKDQLQSSVALNVKCEGPIQATDTEVL